MMLLGSQAYKYLLKTLLSTPLDAHPEVGLLGLRAVPFPTLRTGHAVLAAPKWVRFSKINFAPVNLLLKEDEKTGHIR